MGKIDRQQSYWSWCWKSSTNHDKGGRNLLFFRTRRRPIGYKEGYVVEDNVEERQLAQGGALSFFPSTALQRHLAISPRISWVPLLCLLFSRVFRLLVCDHLLLFYTNKVRSLHMLLYLQHILIALNKYTLWGQNWPLDTSWQKGSKRPLALENAWKRNFLLDFFKLMFSKKSLKIFFTIQDNR